MKAKKRKIRFGIIGMGSVSAFHARSLQQIENGELAAVFDRTREKAGRAGREYGVDHFSDLGPFLQREDMDAVCVCTASGAHLEPAVAAAEAGKHVLVEKPLEITLERADRIIDACENTGVKLGVIFQHRFDRAARELYAAVQSGVLGKLFLGDARIKWYRSPAYYADVDWRGTLGGDGGGALINQSIHTIDLLQWMMGPVRSVYGKVGTVAHKIDGEDIGAALLTFNSGALGVIEGSTALYPGLDERLEIHGENGTVILEGGNIKLWAVRGSERMDNHDTSKSSGAADPMAIPIEAHRDQITDFIEAILDDRDPLVDGKEGRKSLEIVRAIYRSSKEKRAIELGD